MVEAVDDDSFGTDQKLQEGSATLPEAAAWSLDEEDIHAGGVRGMMDGHTSLGCQSECMAQADLHRWTHEALSGHRNLESFLTVKKQLY